MPTITDYKIFFETNTLNFFSKIGALSSLKPFNLNEVSVQANIKIYVGKIIYDLSRKEIERIQDHAKYLQVVLYQLFAH